MEKKIYRDCPTPEIKCSECPISDSCQEETAYAILCNCKSFYYVYCWLAQETQMPIYDGNQKNFEADLDCYIKKHTQQPALTISKWTNGALAAELALKFLFAREHQSYNSIHYLNDLFYRLPDVHKEELLDRLKTQSHQTEKTIEDQLALFSDAFVKSRYFFEHRSLSLTGLFDSFVKIVCEYVLEFDNPNDCEVEE